MEKYTAPFTAMSMAEQEALWQQHLADTSEIFNQLEQRLASATRDLDVLRAREQERRLQDQAVIAMAEDGRLPISARLVGIYVRTKYHLWPIVPRVGEAPRCAEPVRVRMLETADALGIHPRTASASIGLVASAGYLTRECRTVWEEDQPRTHVFLASGPGCTTEQIATPRLDYQREQKRAEYAAREARERQYQHDIELLQRAARYAREMGCPLCGGALAPTGYYCASCGVEHTTEALARLPVLEEETVEESASPNPGH